MVKTGGRFGLSFSWKQPAIPADVVERLRDWLSEAARLPGDAVIKVNEIICADPACPGTETILLVMAPGFKTKAYKLQGDAVAVTQADIAAVAAEAGGLMT
jgi:hypothetical protein